MDQIEQKAERVRFRDWILENILIGVSKDKNTQGRLVLRGAGALHFIYSCPRYSADVDFAAPNFEEDKELVLDMVNNLYFVVENKPIRPELRASDNKRIRVAYFTPNQSEVNGKIEVVSDAVGRHRISTGKYAPLLVETPEQIYADKIFATMNRMEFRNSIKGTDLFDLEWLVHNFENGRASEELLDETAKARNYVGWTKQNAERVISYISRKEHHLGFLRQFRRSMDPDFFNSTNFDEEFFEKALRHFEPLRKYL